MHYSYLYRRIAGDFNEPSCKNRAISNWLKRNRTLRVARCNQAAAAYSRQKCVYTYIRDKRGVTDQSFNAHRSLSFLETSASNGTVTVIGIRSRIRIRRTKNVGRCEPDCLAMPLAEVYWKRERRCKCV